MSQRLSGYRRRPDESYETPAWGVAALRAQLRGPIRRAWDPCDRNSGALVAALRAQGIDAVGTGEDFFTITTPPPEVDAIITNPPYGEGRRGELAVAFIEHALELALSYCAMLLRNDFDSALGRQHLFRRCPAFAGKVVLLNRIKWFAGPSSPSDNHAWMLWSRSHVGPPIIQYVTRAEAEAQS
jgi:predicted RNA methylase